MFVNVLSVAADDTMAAEVVTEVGGSRMLKIW